MRQGPAPAKITSPTTGYDYAIVEIGDQCWFAENPMISDGSPVAIEAVRTLNPMLRFHISTRLMQ